MIKKIGINVSDSIVYKSEIKTVIQIQDIQSKKARNLIRGIDPSNSNETKKALNKIKLNCNESDYRKSLLYLRTNHLFDGNDIGQLFNCECPKGMHELVEYSEKEITKQINNHSEKLNAILICAIKLNTTLKDTNLKAALELCDEMVTLKGTSVFLIKSLSFIKNRFQLLNMTDTEILTRIDSIKTRIKLSKSPFIEDALTQLSNLRTPHLTLCKKINNINECIPYGEIAKSFISPIPKDLNDYKKKLSSFFAFSLFDAFLYIKMIEKIHLSFVARHIFTQMLNAYYDDLIAIYFSPKKMYKELDENVGHCYLRECFLFIEQPRSLNYLAIHGSFYSESSSISKVSPYAESLIKSYFHDINELGQLRCCNIEKTNINWEKFNKNTCNSLENSSALIYLLNKKQGILSQDEKFLFVKLMSFTLDIGETCHPDFLSEIAKSAENDQAKLVAQCLVTLNKKNQYNEHLLRTAIQKYCINEFNGNLINLLRDIYKISPSVAEHLLLLFNETFLCTLFYLVEKPVDALQIRAEMFQWFAEETNDEMYLDRAKTLRIDIQINKEKGTIDDSRIYVDELKYKQWFEDYMVNDISMSLDKVMIKSVNIIEFNSQTNPLDNIFDHLLKCYKEFCENKIFGIASYLGRRIRHGTFKGTVFTEVKSLSKKEEYQNLFRDLDFKNAFTLWLNKYEEMVENLVNTQLQINSKKKPNGLITTKIDSNIKKSILNQMLIEITDIYSTTTGIIRLPTTIMEYCWRLAENDLSKTKKVLSEFKSLYGIFNYNLKGCSYLQKKQLHKFTQELNSITGKKFGLVSSWFNKPNYASPSTDIYLLFNVVVSEVKESITSFKPIFDFGDKEFPVKGGTYYIIYDALYVLIHNAARHGKSDGKIQFSVSLTDDARAIKINLNTELESLELLSEASIQMDAAFAIAVNDDDAHIFEGKSGIKKIRQLEKEGSISNVSYSIDSKNIFLCFEFYFELSSRGKYSDIDS